MQYVIQKPVAVITPTIGTDKLEDAIESVASNSYRHTHYVVIDGIERNDVRGICADYKNVKIIDLPMNTGAMGFYGHRIYAAMSKLVDEDYVLFLDEDNMYEPSHIADCVEAMERNQNAQFGHTLRKIVSPKNEFLIYDNCESLGNWPIAGTNEQFLIDTSCFIFRNRMIRTWGHHWDHGWGGDRRFLSIVRSYQIFPLTIPKYSVRYRLDGNPNSVTEEFFKQGNALSWQKYQGKLPWTQSSALSPGTGLPKSSIGSIPFGQPTSPAT